MTHPITQDKKDDVHPEQIAAEHELIQKILRSESFRSAQMLQHLLLYLAENAKGNESGSLKEYAIGVEALGRKSDFDPKVDPIVRVQMHRLRQKLGEYYRNEGVADARVLEIPKGQYEPVFRSAVIASASEAPEPAEQQHSVEVAESHVRRLQVSRPFFLVVVAFACGVFSTWFWMKTSGGLTTPDDTPAAVRTFWSQFLGNDKAPIIGYPDAVFLLDESNDLFRFRQGATDQRGSLVTAEIVQQDAANPQLATKAGPLYYENGYTGTGELESVAMLSSLFASLHTKPTIKSSRDITMADFEQHSVILLGSPFQNPAAAQLPEVGDFVFDNPDAHRELWRGRIVDQHPGNGSPTVYQTVRDAQTGVLRQDYGLISIRQGVAPGLHIAVLGGLDTSGTHGVARYAISCSGTEQMQAAMTALLQGKASGFQELLRINLQKGYEVHDTQLVTSRVAKGNSASTSGAH